MPPTTTSPAMTAEDWERAYNEAQAMGNGLYSAIIKRLIPYFPEGDRGLEWDVLPSTIAAMARELASLRAKPAAMDGDVRIAEIKAREAKATKGPWINHHDASHAKGGYVPQDIVQPHFDPKSPGYPVAYCYTADRKANGDFIAASREDIPYLVAQVESLRAELARRDAIAPPSPAPDAEGKR